MQRVVEAGSEPGLLAYREGQAVGWISVAPRPQYGRILRSRRIGPVPDEASDESVWSVVCFWIPRGERGKGIASELLKAGVAHARERGATMLEAYPVDTAGGRKPSANLFTGTLAMFRRAGFREAERPRGAQLVVRLDL
jgi:GNAT superfamily N-acetyltransferase